MNKYLKVAICAALPIAWGAGCNSFLQSSDVQKNPNSPTQGSATNGQLFQSIQVNNWVLQESDLARLSALWMQQLRGAARQMLGVYTQYTSVNEATYDAEFQRPYTGGGLVDIRTLDAGAVAANDSAFLGIADIIEAWMIGTVADIWGDIPYSQAANSAFPTPQLDSQAVVYDSVQSKLSQGIANVAKVGSGPGAIDAVYGGDPAKWAALAHTLKARFYLHTAEKIGASAYASALSEATQGISSNDGDYTAIHSGQKTFESNPWWQFMDADGGTGRAQDIVSDTQFLANLLATTSDPRRAVYFQVPANPSSSSSGMNPDRLSPTFSQPFVTFNETLLIIAEAKFQTGDEAGALAALNQERAAWGTATAWHPAVALPAASGSGAALLTAIMTEKYITQFQNVEVWNDYKRTCIPHLTPTGGATQIPGRLPYGVTERQTNPNIPPIGSQPARNWNDPNACP